MHIYIPPQFTPEGQARALLSTLRLQILSDCLTAQSLGHTFTGSSSPCSAWIWWWLQQRWRSRQFRQQSSRSVPHGPYCKTQTHTWTHRQIKTWHCTREMILQALISLCQSCRDKLQREAVTRLDTLWGTLAPSLPLPTTGRGEQGLLRCSFTLMTHKDIKQKQLISGSCPLRGHREWVIHL